MKTKKKYPRAEQRIKLQKQLLLEQLVKMPILEAVCKKIDVSRSTIYRWRDEDPAFAKAYNKAMEAGADVLDDVAESKLLELINRADPSAVFFYLKHRHHKFSPVAAAFKQKRLEKFEESKREMTDEQKRKLDMMLEDITVFQAQYKNEGLVIHDPQSPEVPPTTPEEPTAL